MLYPSITVCPIALDMTLAHESAEDVTANLGGDRFVSLQHSYMNSSSGQKVMININSSNATLIENTRIIYAKNVYHFMSGGFVTCSTYDPPDKSPTGFVERVKNLG